MANVNGLDALFARAGGQYPPPSVVQSWPKPNHVDPETRGWAVPIMLIVVLIFTFMVYSARMWARLMIAKNAGLDDLLMSIAMVFVVGSTIAVVLGIRIYGFQWHVWDQTRRTAITTRQITLAIEMLYLQATTLIKISILCFYRRLTSGSITKVFLYWVWASIVFVVCSAVIFTFIIIFSYSPVEAYWHIHDTSWKLQNEFRGLDEAAIILSVTLIGTFQDILICTLPMTLVRNLQIETRQKVALICIFGLGLVTCISGIMRTYYAIYIYYGTYDITWYAFYAWIWTALETDLGVICASAPALRVFFRRYFNIPTNFNSNSGPTGNNGPWKTVGESNMGSKRCKTDIVPMDCIKIGSRRHVTIENRDEDLTTLPSTTSIDKSEQSRGCVEDQKVCTTIRQDSTGRSKNASWDTDIDKYAGAD